MKEYILRYKPFGPSAILIEWPARIEEDILYDILSFEECIPKDPNILDTIIAYHSLTIRYTSEIDFNSKLEQLKKINKFKEIKVKQASKLWKIPVCYDPDLGPDLKEVAEAKNLSVEEVIKLHTTPNYLVYFIGFQPGFLYLGGLNKKIHIDRKPSPRLRVPKGSVGIGGEQTGVYPHESAGGWNILGKSPVDFFDANKPEPCFTKPGDRIKFEPIDLDEFNEVEAAVQEGSYELKYQSL